MLHIVPDSVLLELGRICTSSAWIRNELARQTNLLSKAHARARRTASPPNFTKLLREWQKGWHGVVEAAKYRAVIYPLSRDLAKAWVQRTDAVEGCWRQIDHLVYEVTLRDRPEMEQRQTYTLAEIQGIARGLIKARAKLDQIGEGLA